jgi:hypothetical protein
MGNLKRDLVCDAGEGAISRLAQSTLERLLALSCVIPPGPIYTYDLRYTGGLSPAAAYEEVRPRPGREALTPVEGTFLWQRRRT